MKRYTGEEVIAKLKELCDPDVNGLSFRANSFRTSYGTAFCDITYDWGNLHLCAWTHREDLGQFRFFSKCDVKVFNLIDSLGKHRMPVEEFLLTLEALLVI